MTPKDPEVVAILEAAGLGHLAGRFAAEDIDRAVLRSLRDADLRDLGLTLGQRKKLLEQLSAQASPAPAVAQPELRRLTVLFSDLVKFTELTTRIDPDDMRAILQSYYDAARDAAKEFGGFIASLQGDGVVMLFGFPATEAGNADRAVGAAHAMLARIGGMSHLLPDGHRIGIAARIGIASGRAIVHYPNGVAKGEPQIVGPVTNRAARLQAIAGPGMVVVDEATRTLAASAFTFAALPDAELKGFEHRIPVAQAIAPATLHRERTEPSIRSAHRREVRELSAAWQSARGGQPVLALVTGDAGIGKSTLLAEFAAGVARDGARVLRLACSAVSAQMPLQPVIALLEGMLGSGADARLAALRRLLSASPAESVDAVAALLGLPSSLGNRLAAPAENRRLSFGALSAFLTGDGSSPCLITVEDIHWADDSTRALLQACAETIPANGLMFLATSRDARDPIWSGSPIRLHIPLAPLEQTSAEAVMQHYLPEHDLPEKIVQTILARSGGNPLMIEALTRSAKDWQDVSPGHELEVPASIYESISGRIEALKLGRKVASVLAVFDEPASEAVLATALGAQEGDLGEVLAELAAAGIVERAGDGRQDTIRFRHNLYRAVCYERLVKSVRQELHRTAYSTLTKLHGGMAQQRPGLLALHAYEGGDYAQAAPLALAAGEQALTRSALIEANHFLRQALTSLDRIERTRNTERLRLRVLVSKAAMARARQGIASDEVGELGRQVLDLACELGESRSELIALNGLYAHALVRADYSQARVWAERLCDTAQAAQDQTFLMIGYRGLGVVAFHTAAFSEAAAKLRQALDMYDEERHAPLAHVHGYDHAEICAVFLSMTLWVQGDLAGAAKVSAFSAAHARKIRHMHSLAQAQVFRAMLMATARDGDACVASAQEAGEVSQKHGLWMLGASRFFGEAGALMARPAPPGSAELASLREKHREFKQSNPYNYQPLTGVVMADLHLDGHALEQAEDALRDAEDAQDRTGEIFARPELTRVKARSLHLRGDREAAMSLLRAAYDDAVVMEARTFALRIACDLAEADPSREALDRVHKARAQLISEDKGWDLRRCQSLLETALLA